MLLVDAVLLVEENSGRVWTSGCILCNQKPTWNDQVLFLIIASKDNKLVKQVVDVIIQFMYCCCHLHYYILKWLCAVAVSCMQQQAIYVRNVGGFQAL